MVAPLTPSCCDLRDFSFIPLQIGRLKQSRAWLLCKRNPALAFYLMNTWTAAFQSVPAGSIENDDMVLADIAMCDDATWTRIKPDVLRGWVEGDDGRLYHPVVAEHALEGWIQKLAQRKATAAASAARSKVTFDPAPFDMMTADALDHLRRVAPQSRTLAKRCAKAEGLPIETTQPAASPLGPPDGSPGGGAPPVHQVDHQGTGTATGRRIDSPSDKSSGEGAQARRPAQSASALPNPSGDAPGDPPDDRGHCQPVRESPISGESSGAVVPFPAAKPPSRGAKRRETLWPDDLAMTEADRTFAAERGYVGPAATRLWSLFENRSRAKALTYVDWHCAWRTFVLKQLEFDGRAGSGRPPFGARTAYGGIRTERPPI